MLLHVLLNINTIQTLVNMVQSVVLEVCVPAGLATLVPIAVTVPQATTRHQMELVIVCQFSTIQF